MMGSISSKRDSAFIEWQKSVKDINDDVIKEHIIYDRYLDLVTNPVILSYIDNRFSDSYSRTETLQRIRKGMICPKPLCPVCGNPVTWIGRKRGMFTKFCSNPSCYNGSTEQKEKKKRTQLEHWGTTGVYDSPKYKELMKERYGVEHVSQIDYVKEKRKDTMQERYGTTNIFAVPSIREKIEATCNEKFGYPSALQSPEVRKKMYDSCMRNSKFQTSHIEDVVFDELCAYGYNVVRHYRTDDFPYAVDFYLPDYNLRIEYQGSQFHNGRAYFGTDDDIKEVERIKSLSDEKKKEKGVDVTQYDKIIYVWTELDVKKRELAKELNLPYLEIYSDRNVIGQVELMLSCMRGDNPFHYDCSVLSSEKEYYLSDIKKLPRTVDSRNTIVKHFQGREFFRNEIRLYASNPVIRRRVVQNRIEYLHKKEYELSVSDIFRGFKISGVYYGYSHFNPFWIKWFVKKYGVNSVYDPCGGWGHHIIGMQSCSKVIYNELNRNVCDNAKRIADYIGISNFVSNNGDAIEYIPENVDAFFMCPPYFNLEDYGDGGFSSIDDYKGFLNKIFEIWKENSAKVFGVLIREDYIGLIDDFPIEKYIVNSAASHFGKKKFNEYLYVFRK